MTTDAQSALAQVREAMAAGPTPGEWVRRAKHGDEQWGVEIRTVKGARPVIVDGCATPATVGYVARCNPANIAAILAHVDAQEAEIERLRAGLRAVSDLIDESHGVAGLHRNGDVAPWSDLRTGGKYEE